MTMKHVSYITILSVGMLLCGGCDRTPVRAPVATAGPIVEFRIAVNLDDLSELELNHLLLALSDNASHGMDRYEWIRSCGKHSWPNRELDPAKLNRSDEPLLYRALLVEDLIVARMDGHEYILVHARSNTVGSVTRDEPSHSMRNHMVIDVQWAHIERTPRARGGQGAMVPGLILAPDSAEEMSRFARDHLLAKMVVVIDDCVFGFTQFSGFASPEFFQERGFYIDGDFEREDVFALIRALRGS